MNKKSIFLVFFYLGFSTLMADSIQYLKFMDDVPLERRDIVYTPVFLDLWTKIREELLNGGEIHFLKKGKRESLLNRESKKKLFTTLSSFPLHTHTVGTFKSYLFVSPIKTFKKRIAQEIGKPIVFQNLPVNKNLSLSCYWAYGVLSKAITFSKNDGFDVSRMFFIPKKGKKICVKSYSLEIKSKNITDVSQYLSVIHYVNFDHFCIKISFPKAKDEFFFFKIPQQWTFKKNMDYFFNICQSKGPKISLNQQDHFLFPDIYFDRRENHFEYENNPLTNKEKEGIFFSNVFSHYHVEMVLDASDASSEGKKGESSLTMNIHRKRIHQRYSRIYAFNKPFFFILKKKERKDPYCIFWVKNNSFFTIFSKK